VVSYAGAVWGSPLADEADEKQLRWLTLIPGAECEKKDSKALETLSPENRQAWFAEHTLPEHIRYYSVVSFPDPENISNGLAAVITRQAGSVERTLAMTLSWCSTIR